MGRVSLRIWLLRVAAVAALAWSVWRAARQSVTQDEADTWFWFASQGPRFLWYPLPNNHLLNTLLIRASTLAFGLSPLALRLPALAGGAIYVAVAYWLCRALSDRFALQLAAFLCLVYNPFVLDFFAAARGYSLANGFLLAALAIPVRRERGGRWPAAACAAMASAAVGLSFAANFSFAYVDVAALAAVAIWALARRGRDGAARVLGCCLVPAGAIAFGLCGYPILHYPRRELWYGARSVAETAASLVDACLYRLPRPLDSAGARTAGEALLLAIAALAGARLGAAWMDRGLRRSAAARMAAAIAGMVIFTAAAHLAAFRWFAVPLPLSRTAIFFLPLGTLLAVLAAALPGKSRAGRGSSGLLTALLLCLSAHYLLTLRSTYFREYEIDADMEDVYGALEGLHRTYGISEFVADGAYRSPLNFYRVVERGGFPALAGYVGPLPPGKPAYVLHDAVYGKFIREHKLAIVYRGRQTRVVVAVPEGSPVPAAPVTAEDGERR